MKGLKTTIVATIFAMTVLGLMISMVLDLITFAEFKDTVTLITAAAVATIGWFAKDANKSHTKP